MMSKASEWAARTSEAEDAARWARRGRPAPFCVHLETTVTLEFSVEDNGKAGVTFGGRGYRPDVARLIEAARWILDNFGDA